MEALPIPTSPAEPASRYLNRELSWLDFNERVLALAEDEERPILARVKFLAICSQSLDEFFQVRVSGLLEQVEAGVIATTPDGMRPEEQLAEIRSRVTATSARIERLFSDELRPALDKEGIRLVDTADLTDEDRAWSTDSFAERIFPVLTPLAVDPAHPFPYISSLSLNLAVLVRDPVTGVRRFARLKMPPLLPRFFPLPDGERFIPIEQVVAAHLDRLFPGMEIVTHHVFRVTRDADLDVEEDEAEDLLAAVESVLSRRRRGATSVRLEVERSMTDEVRSLLMRELDLDEDHDLRDRRTPRSGGALGIRRARPVGAQGGAVDARHALPAGVGGRAARRLPGPARGRRRPRAPPVRLVLVLGGSLRSGSRRRSRRDGDQADAVPHLGGYARSSER